MKISPATERKEKLFLVDGNAYLYRAFYAIKELVTSRGEPTGAIYGFTNLLFKLLREERPDYLAVAFDLPLPTFRHREFPGYKAQRPEMPDDLKRQFPPVKEIIATFGIPLFECPGYEADDILATLARRGMEEGKEVFILSSDKDMLQLVNASIFVINPRREGVIYNAARVRECFGVDPAQMPDLLALWGDASDNIPGVAGIGRKTAVKLIQEFGSLENLLDNLARLKSRKQRENLEASREAARLARRLVTLDREVPLELELDKCRPGQPDRAGLRKLFARFELKKFAREI